MRRLQLIRLFLGICGLLFVRVPLLGDEAPPAASPTKEQRAALEAENAPLVQQVLDLEKQGKLKEAVAIIEKVLAAEQKVLGNLDKEIANTSLFLAPKYERLEEFEATRRARADILTIFTHLYGKDHYRVTDCRCALEYTVTLSQLTAEQRSQLERAHALLAQVGTLHGKSKYGEAIALAEEVLSIRQAVLGKRHRDIANAAGWLGELHRLSGKYAQAEQFFLQAIDIDREAIGETHPVFARDLNNLAAIFKARANYKQAVPLFRQSLELTKNIYGEGHPEFASSLNNLALTYEAQGNLAEAEPLLLKALEVRKAALGEAHPDYARSLNSLASLYQAQGHYDRALPLLEQTVAIHKQSLGEAHPLYANSLHNLASLLVEQGHYTRAEPLYLQALEIYRKVLGEKHPRYATTLNQLGILFHTIGDYAQAEERLAQSLEITKGTVGEAHPSYATGLNNLASVYSEQGDSVRAAQFYRQALEVVKATLGESHPGFASCLRNLALVHKMQGDFARAEPLYLQAIEVCRKSVGENHDDFGRSLLALADCYHAQREYERAEPLYEQGCSILKNTLGPKHQNYSTGLNNHGLNCVSRRDYRRAESLFREALEIMREAVGTKNSGYANFLHNVGFVQDMQGNHAKAEPFYREAYEIKKEVLGESHSETAKSLGELARIRLEQRNYAGAESDYRKVLAIFRNHLKLAANLQSERQQLAMLANVRFRLDAFIRLGFDSPNHRTYQWEEVLAWKGVVLARQRALHAASDSPELKPLLAELQANAARLAALSFATPAPEKASAWREQIAELSAKKESLEQQLAAASTAFRDAIRPVTAADVQAALPPQAALIDFVQYEREIPAAKQQGESPKEPAKSVYENRLAAFVVRREGAVTMVDLGPVQPLREAIDIWRAGLGRTTASQAAGAQLREKLWLPIEDYLTDITTVLISPDGDLGKLTFAALPGKKPGHYLLEEFALAVVPAPQAIVLTASDDPLDSTAGLLAIGGVEYDRAAAKQSASEPSIKAVVSRAARDEDVSAFAPLPGTLGELTTIQKLHRGRFAGQGQKILQVAAATEQALLEEAPRSRYLHLATHGYFAAPRFQSALDRSAERDLDGKETFVSNQSLAGYHPGLLSGIALAGANQPTETDDGILTAVEVGTLNLSGCDLVVLSACETGLGKTANGEGLLGLQRAFQIAGAKSLVGSLWSVDDKATETLMTEFYRNLWYKKLSKIESLRQAQLTMLAQYDPATKTLQPRGLRPVITDDSARANRLPAFYWAAFVLSGDWR